VINLIAFGIIGLPIGYTLCFKTPLGISPGCTPIRNCLLPEESNKR
jgi:hypothetical protein